VTAAPVDVITKVESAGVKAVTLLVTLDVAVAVLVTVTTAGDGPKVAVKGNGLLAAAAFL
jgi:hypothetical protein